MIEQILKALLDSQARPDSAPDQPGLYAIFGSKEVWGELGLGQPTDQRPLYLGKAERSLLGRDVKQHFGTGATGSSTVRRTLAALLKEQFGFVGVPRNLEKPGHFSMYSLGKQDDEQLTEWMQSNLLLGTWVPDESTELDSWETRVLEQWKPPLNLSKLRTKWTSRVKAARKTMAQEAERWVSNEVSGSTSLDGCIGRLLELGFRRVGDWRIHEGALQCALEGMRNSRNVLYAFTAESRILYIGKSTRSLIDRMKGYAKPGPSQRTNIRNAKLISELVASGEQVDILAWTDPGKLSYGGFRVNLAAGLEDSLIAELSPPWNGMRSPKL